MRKNSITFRLGLLSLSIALFAGSLSNQALAMRQPSSQAVELTEDAIQQKLEKAAQSLDHRQATRARSILLRLGSVAEVDGYLEQQRLRLLVRTYYLRGQPLKAVRLQARLLDQVERVESNNTDLLSLWHELSQLSEKQLKEWITWIPNDKRTVGWFRLALVMRQDETGIEALQQWQQNYPEHAGHVLLPSQLNSSDLEGKATAEQIALLLPLTGPYAKQGEAVRRGFYATYFEEKKKPGHVAPVIQVYDTNQASIETLTQQLRDDGVTHIVGPLLKDNVRQLIDNRPSQVPALVLNTVDKSSSGVLQFALSPEAAVDQLTMKMAAAKQWRVAVLVPDTVLGERLYNRFQANWKEYHGDQVGLFRYSEQANYSTGIRQLFQVDQAKARVHRVKKIVGEKLRFIADRRHDLDAVLLIGNRSAAKSLKPLLDFYFAGNLPVYATSQLLDRSGAQQEWSDLNGLRFLATPWQLKDLVETNESQQQVQEQLQKTWPAMTQKYGAFYAMGMDAYRLLDRLPLLQAVPAFSYLGETGLLSVDNDGHIFPQLFWARLSQGKPKLLANY